MQSACRHDGLEEDTVFACFSEGNPFTPYLDRLFLQYQEARASYLVWGYVGQRLT
jgi:hypothetical protein